VELSGVANVSKLVPTLAEGRMIIEETTDEQLVDQVRSGDRDAFAVLVERYKRGIANFIAAGVRAPSDVADLTQETFLRAFAHLGTYNPDLGRFSTWLYHIARNVVRTFLGRSQRRPAAADLGEDRTLENSVADVSADADPMGGVLRAEAEAEVRAALATLPERTRTVLALRFYDNMDYQTIATTMGLSLGNVKTLIHRGKLALAQTFHAREAAAIAGTTPAAGLRGHGELQLV
jgi:RNA polymerase sigma-70 factor (ECF subfamily)